MIEHFELVLKEKLAAVGWLPEVESLRQDDVVVSESELNIVLADGKDVAEARVFQFLKYLGHARQNFLKEIGRGVRHGRLSNYNIPRIIRLQNLL